MLALGLDSVTVKVAVPAASLTVTSSMRKLGVSSSTMVPVPLAAGLVVVPPVTVAFRVKVSLPSARLSLAIGVRTCTLVLPAGMVAAVALTQAPPTNTSRPAP